MLYTAASDAVFNAHEETNFQDITQKQLKQEMRRAGVRAVVEALRDAYTSTGYRMLTNHHFNEIIGDAGDGAE
jgi:hypothetical protein